MNWELLQHRRRDTCCFLLCFGVGPVQQRIKKQNGCRLDSSPVERSHTGQTQAGCCKQMLCATRKAKHRRYRTTDDVERHGARLATTSDPALQPVRAEVACVVCFFSREVLLILVSVPSQVRGAPAQRVAGDRLTKARAPGRPSHKHVLFSQSLWSIGRQLCSTWARLESTGTLFLFQLRTRVLDNHIHPRLLVDECEVPAGLTGSKCSLTLLGQDSVSGAQAKLGHLLLVGPPPREWRWSRQCSEITDVWLTLQELTVQSPNRDVLPVFDRTLFPSAHTASSEPNQ